MTTFGLIHGGAHGAWCWSRLTPELERLGASVVTVDLPVDDPDAGLDEYAALTAEAFDGHEEIVPVAHSLMGLILPLVAERIGARSVLFLCALVPEPGLSAADQLRRDPSMNNAAIAPADAAHAIDPSPDLAIELLYHDCDRADALWAVSQMRMQAARPWNQPSPLQAWPEIQSHYVLGTQDRCVMPEWSRKVAGQRLACTPVELPTGHSPFLVQPAALATALITVARA